jgi:hypothetical protein
MRVAGMRDRGIRMLNLRGNRLTYYGHSTFSVRTPSGQVVLIDLWVQGNPAMPGTAQETGEG